MTLDRLKACTKKELADKYRLLRFTYGWEFAGPGAHRGTVTAPADSQ